MKKILFIIGIIVAFAACAKIENKPTVEVSDKLIKNGDYVYAYLTKPGILYQLYKNDYSKEYGEEIWDDVVKIKIDGVIDARDFSTLKWNFRKLQDLDISGVSISEYRGEHGTNEGYYNMAEYPEYSVYNANEIPIGAFFYWERNDIREFPQELFDEGMPSLHSIKLPEGIKTIRRNAFARAYNLREINIPEGVETVEMVALRYCMGVEKLYLPSTLKNIGWLTFTEMPMLKEVHIAAKEKPEENNIHNEAQSFGNRLDASQVQGEIGQIFRGWVVDVEGMESHSYKTNATLYVPKGCKNNYKKWEKYFQNIVEE